MERTRNIQVLKDMVSLDYPLYYWSYSLEGVYQDTNCPVEKVTMCDWLMRHSGCLDCANDLLDDAPMLLENERGLTWVAVWERNEEDVRCQLHVLGPCFPYGAPPASETYVDLEYSKASPGLRKKLYDILEVIPVVNALVLNQYALMLDYCVNNRHSTSRDLVCPVNKHTNTPSPVADSNRRRIYQAERSLLAAVRDGSKDISKAQEIAKNIASVRPYVKDELLQVQISVTIFISLCVRAAIEGGVSPEVSYSVGDEFIRRVFSARFRVDLAHISDEMYQTFVEMTHAHRKNPNLSKIVQETCEYIELHLYDEITLDILSQELGYTKYYLSRCFSDETHCSVNQYIYIVRIERAKLLLETTQESIADIAAKLQFASPSHFSTVFKKIVGQSPGEYRNAN